MKSLVMEAWDESPEADEIVQSARAAIEGIVRMGSEVLEDHKKVLISRMLWKITEANGKYNTRFFSERARKSAKSDKRHDHVWPRKSMIERILANPECLDREIRRTIGCVVTKTEHENLTQFDAECDGWDRYMKANIKVWDRKGQRRISDDWE